MKNVRFLATGARHEVTYFVDAREVPYFCLFLEVFVLTSSNSVLVDSCGDSRHRTDRILYTYKTETERKRYEYTLQRHSVHAIYT